MIKSFKDKKLKKAFETSNYSKFDQRIQTRIKYALTMLDATKSLDELMKLSKLRCHLYQKSKDWTHKVYLVDAGDKERIFFKIIDGNIYDVGLGDPH